MKKKEIENILLKELYECWDRGESFDYSYNLRRKKIRIKESLILDVLDELEDDNLLVGSRPHESSTLTTAGILEAERRLLVDPQKMARNNYVRFQIMKSAVEVYETRGKASRATHMNLHMKYDFNNTERINNGQILTDLELIISFSNYSIRSTKLGREYFAGRAEENVFAKDLLSILQSKASQNIKMAIQEKYDIALSFAGENREYVEEVATELKHSGIRVFYDNFETANLWGKDLFTHLQNVYQKQARYTVIFISSHYAKKLWTNHERKMAQARAFSQASEYILPVRFDDTEIDGIPPTTAYIDLRDITPKELCNIIYNKLDLDISANEDSLITPWTQNNANIVAFGQSNPDFPATLPDYRLAENNEGYWNVPFEWKGTVRIFYGNGWTEISNFPHTMNHCNDGIFMLRWRTANPQVRITTAVGYSPENAIEGDYGNRGYMWGTNCEQPLFKFVDTNDESTLVDIYYEMRFWQAAP